MPIILPWEGTAPSIAEDCFVAPNATIIGDVVIGEGSSVWFGSVIRGDVNSVRIGERTNIQDLTTCHVTTDSFNLTIGDRVTIGHRCIIHGCTIGNRVTIGMGSIIMDGAQIGDESIVAAGAVVMEGAKYPPRSFIVGLPAKLKGKVPEKKLGQFDYQADHYYGLIERYKKLTG